MSQIDHEIIRDVMRIVPMVMREVSGTLRQIAHPSHYHLLAVLAASPRSPGALAEIHNVSAASMSNTIRTLEDHGWVTRTQAPHDRRAWLVEVTGQGRQVLEAMQAAAESAIASQLLPLSLDEIHTLQAGLEVLERAFSKDNNAACQLPSLEEPAAVERSDK